MRSIDNLACNSIQLRGNGLDWLLASLTTHGSSFHKNCSA
jgi:hypothetical protein